MSEYSDGSNIDACASILGHIASDAKFALLAFPRMAPGELAFLAGGIGHSQLAAAMACL